MQDVEISLRNRLRIEKRIRFIVRFGSSRRTDAAIDHEMGDVDALRLQFARKALRQAAQGDFAIANGADRG